MILQQQMMETLQRQLRFSGLSCDFVDVDYCAVFHGIWEWKVRDDKGRLLKVDEKGLRLSDGILL